MISKKLTVAIVAAGVLIFGERLDLPLDSDTKQLLVGLVSAYLLGQGVADFGKGAKRA